MKTSLPWIGLLLLALLSACASGTPAPTVTSVPLIPSPSPESASAIPDLSTATSTPSPGNPRPATPTPLPQPLSQYVLTARLDYDLHILSVEERIIFINDAPETLTTLPVIVEPNLYPGVFHLDKLAWGDGQTISQYTLQGHLLQVSLSESLLPNESLDLAIAYTLVLPNQTSPFGYTNRQTNLGDWYPFVPPYLPGKGWIIRDDAFFGENLAYDIADFRVDIQLTSPTAANGLPLTVAASALAEREGDWYRYTHENARNFAWTVSDQYQTLTTTVGDITVLAYSFPYHPTADEPALQTTAKALQVFSDLFSPYPHKSLSVVEGDFLDGMEYDGLFFLSHAFYDYFTGTPENNLILIAAHETAHQWWYGRVGNDQALEPWLDESLATYSEILFYEQVYPDLAQWWWDNRVYFHKPEGRVDMTIYQAGGFHPYRDAVYLRGALFLNDLREQLGDEAFIAFLRDYLARYTHRIATADDFFALLTEHTSADLRPLTSQYFAHR